MVSFPSIYSSARMKVLAVDESHVILYKCLDYDTSQGTCRADATHVNVLSHESGEDLSPSVITWAANAVHQACIEFGDMDHTHHSSQLESLSLVIVIVNSKPVSITCFFNDFEESPL